MTTFGSHPIQTPSRLILTLFKWPPFQCHPIKTTSLFWQSPNSKDLLLNSHPIQRTSLSMSTYSYDLPFDTPYPDDFPFHPIQTTSLLAVNLSTWPLFQHSSIQTTSLSTFPLIKWPPSWQSLWTRGRCATRLSTWTKGPSQPPSSPLPPRTPTTSPPCAASSGSSPLCTNVSLRTVAQSDMMFPFPRFLSWFFPLMLTLFIYFFFSFLFFLFYSVSSYSSFLLRTLLFLIFSRLIFVSSHSFFTFFWLSSFSSSCSMISSSSSFFTFIFFLIFALSLSFNMQIYFPMATIFLPFTFLPLQGLDSLGY